MMCRRVKVVSECYCEVVGQSGFLIMLHCKENPKKTPLSLGHSYNFS